jgi:hypothetical protein
MQKIFSVLIIAGFVLLPAFLFAQFNNNTTSPFSRFGLGDLHGQSQGRTVAMGGATLGSRHRQQINHANPASYTSIDSLSFLFEFGMNGKFANYKNDLGNFSTDDVNFRYFSMSFPISRTFASAIGLTPYSDVGYDVRINQEVENSGMVQHVYYGEGSLTRAFIGLGARPFKNISVGANLFYFFGTLTRNGSVTFPQNVEMYSIQKNDVLRLRDFGVNFGLQATIPLEKEQSLTIGATLENKPTFTGFNSEISYKTLYISIPNANPVGDIDTLTYRNEVKDKIQLPLSVGAGVSYVKNNKMEINADYYYQRWSKASFFGEPYAYLTDRSVIAVGGEYIPDKFSIRSYVSRMAYRAGLSYENSYLLLNNQQVNNFGISFGVGLPVYRSLSTINLSAEFGKRGSMKDGNVRENYMKFNFSVNLHDFWFVKRRFD